MSLVLGEQGQLERKMAGEGFGLAMTCDCSIGARPSPRAAVRMTQSETQALKYKCVSNVAKSHPPWGAGSGAIRDTPYPGGGK
jgi:hypothetical protein